MNYKQIIERYDQNERLTEAEWRVGVQVYWEFKRLPNLKRIADKRDISERDAQRLRDMGYEYIKAIDQKLLHSRIVSVDTLNSIKLNK